MTLILFVKTSLRSIFAGVTSFGVGLQAVLVSGSSIGDISETQWLSISLGALIVAGGVWGFVNPKK